jgi:hypothetical protein
MTSDTSDATTFAAAASRAERPRTALTQLVTPNPAGPVREAN